MAHLVEQMFSVKETPWHGLGHIVQEAPNSEEALKIAGLDWSVSKRPVYVADTNGIQVELEGYKAITRDSDNQVYNVLSDNYEPLQNKEAFTFFDQFVENKLARYETAGSLDQGRKVWILASINKDPIKIGANDDVLKFLMLSNAHDGTMAVRVGFTPIRVVCANTLRLAHDDGRSQFMRINHGKSVASNLNLLSDAINLADRKFEATAELYRKLASTHINKDDLAQFVYLTFQTHKIANPESRAAREKKMLEIVTKNFETGRGADLVSANGTLWGAYNAVSEYLNYERGKEQDTRLKALWFGYSAQVNQQALNAAIQLSA